MLLYLGVEVPHITQNTYHNLAHILQYIAPSGGSAAHNSEHMAEVMFSGVEVTYNLVVFRCGSDVFWCGSDMQCYCILGVEVTYNLVVFTIRGGSDLLW